MTAEIDETKGLDANSEISLRRTRLEVQANPGLTLDYLSVLGANLPGKNVSVTLRYVPDKLTLPADAFSDYLANFAIEPQRSLEELALAVLDDINNEVVPRWVQIVAARTDPGLAGHQVIIEDRQPKWDNSALLARLARY